MPVSHTEAAALRRYVSGEDEFLFVETFLPRPAAIVDGNAFLTLAPGAAWFALPPGPVADGLFEAADWLEAHGVVSLVLRAANASGPPPPPPPPPPPGPAPCVAEPALLNGSDVCPGGAPGWRNLDVSGAPRPIDACTAACCAWASATEVDDSCNAFVVAPGPAADAANCSRGIAACCWLKSNCLDPTPSPCANCTAAFVRLPAPPGPPERDDVAGYLVTVSADAASLTVRRRAEPGGAAELLGSASLAPPARPNGVVLGAWSLLRVLLETEGGAVQLRAWWNPAFTDTGFIGEPEDLGRTPLPIAPLVSVSDAAPLPAGGVAILAGGAAMRVDYASALPASVFP